MMNSEKWVSTHFRRLEKNALFALARWLSWLEHNPLSKKKKKKKSRQGSEFLSYIDVSLSLSLSFSLSLSLSLSFLPPSSLSKNRWNISSGEDLKKCTFLTCCALEKKGKIYLLTPLNTTLDSFYITITWSYSKYLAPLVTEWNAGTLQQIRMWANPSGFGMKRWSFQFLIQSSQKIRLPGLTQ